MTIAIYCEGPTEQKVLPALLGRFQGRVSAGRPLVRLEVKAFDGVGEFIKKIGATVRNRVETEGDNVVFGLIDFYGCPLPLLRQNASDADTMARRVADLKSQVNALIPLPYRTRFKVHFAVHELEAWILADERPLRLRLEDSSLGPWAHPETVNLNNPPSKTIAELFKTRLREHYVKPIDGNVLLANADSDMIYDKCPYFHEFVDDLMSACDQEPQLRPVPRRRSR